MKKTVLLLFAGILCTLYSCKNKPQETSKTLTFTEQLELIPNSTSVQGIVIKNLFKSQILVHKDSEFDSLMIVEKVYKPHKELWDSCYSMIFGEENAAKFNTPEGMIAWNKELYPKNKDFFDKQAAKLLALNLDSMLQANLNKFNQFIPYQVEATISLLFTPLIGIVFGGCDKHQFCLELNYTGQDIAYLVEKGIPHELNHLAYEPLRENDPDKETALRQTIDEGFACYFTYLFFDKKITKWEAVENMSEKEWAWYLANEKKIFEQTKQYFKDESGNNPLLRNDHFKLFEDAPKSLNYWLGFRIIEQYIERNGADNWRDIYKMNVQDVLDKSGYEEYINGL